MLIMFNLIILFQKKYLIFINLSVLYISYSICHNKKKRLKRKHELGKKNQATNRLN